MATLSVSVEIDATAARVWSVIEPIERHVEWMADAESIEFDGAMQRGVGTRFRCRTRVGPLRLTDAMEITRWDPPQAMGVRHVGVVTGSGEFTLTAIDLGRRTRFTWTESLRFPWWMAGPLGGWLASRTALAAIWRGNLRRLAALCEAPVRSSPAEPQ